MGEIDPEEFFAMMWDYHRIGIREAAAPVVAAPEGAEVTSGPYLDASVASELAELMALEWVQRDDMDWSPCPCNDVAEELVYAWTS